METMAKGTVQIGTRAVFTLIIVLVALSETFGAEKILGAFLAGVLVSLLSPNKELVHQLDSFGYGFFIPIFFVMVGVDLDLRALVTEPKILTMIPLLVAALAISKIIPVSLLRIWYDTKTTFAAAFLLVSTLSLVIAAATIAERIGVIDENMKGALILVAVISSIVSPILFKKLFVKPKEEDKKIAISFIGTNQFTLSAARELDEHRYEATLYHIQQEKMELPLSGHVFPIVDIEDYSLPTLEKHEAFAADVVVAWTGDEKVNAAVALAAKERGVERVLARMFMNKDAALHEIMMNNSEYEGILLRRFPFMGDCIIVRIFRGNESIVPHGDTELHKGDRLIVTGSGEYVAELRELLE
jgi:CPA2 family monovalent cation:H+ antiporter-2